MPLFLGFLFGLEGLKITLEYYYPIIAKFAGVVSSLEIAIKIINFFFALKLFIEDF